MFTQKERGSYSVQMWLSRIAVKKKFSVTYITSFVFGAAFAVGWTPCVSAILGSVLGLVVTKPALGFILLMSYALDWASLFCL